MNPAAMIRTAGVLAVLTPALLLGILIGGCDDKDGPTDEHATTPTSASLRAFAPAKRHTSPLSAPIVAPATPEERRRVNASVDETEALDRTIRFHSVNWDSAGEGASATVKVTNTDHAAPPITVTPEPTPFRQPLQLELTWTVDKK